MACSVMTASLVASNRLQEAACRNSHVKFMASSSLDQLQAGRRLFKIYTT